MAALAAFGQAPLLVWTRGLCRFENTPGVRCFRNTKDSAAWGQEADNFWEHRVVSLIRAGASVALGTAGPPLL